MDIFKNSIFIDENIKQTLSSELTIYFEEVNKFIDSLAIKTNIYFSGSLARKEPSVKWNGEKYTLESDIDYIFIVSNLLDKEKYFNLDITSELNKKFPNYKNSVVVLTIDEVQNIKSVIGYNLVTGGDNCIREELGKIQFPDIKLNETDFLDSIINIIAILVTYPKDMKKSQIFKSDKEYYEAKLLAEGMKLPFSSSTHIDALYKLNLEVSELDLIEYLSIIKSRELNNNLKIDPRKIITQLLLLKFDFPNVNDFLIYKYKKSNSFINYCQVLFLLKYFEINIENSTFKDIQNILKIDVNNYEQLLNLRVKYMLEVHKKNTETSLISLPDLKNSFNGEEQ